ncbi:MAG: hypothetical protein JOZ75_12415 [Candidatus Dormibacteraeota bacterium]|nr:hypothetical protein [Candidatus Dormibacteraeota bacterium]
MTLEVHYKLFGSDGVSLQSQELARALEAHGWQPSFCASDVPEGTRGVRIADLSYRSDEAIALRARLFGSDSGDDDLRSEIARRARPIRAAIEAYVHASDIPVLHVRNLMSLPYNLPATLAIYEIARERPNLGFLLQHHDLYWEGPNARSFETRDHAVRELMDEIMCPRLPNAVHVLINPIAADALENRFGIAGTVMPDAFDFERELPVIDEPAFRRRLEVLTGGPGPIRGEDLVVSMPARVAINKAIELSMQFVAGLDRARAQLEDAPDGLGSQRRRFTRNSRVVLLLPQGEDLEDNRAYLDRLLDYARHLHITVAYAGGFVVPDRRMQPGDTAHVPFYGTYRAADLVCYSPEHEGFGNQAIETVWARRPLVVLEYPVFKRFVRDHIPHYVSLGGTEELERIHEFGGLHRLSDVHVARAVSDAITVLRDHELERRDVDANFHALRSFCDAGIISARYIELYESLMR